jgi:hypothetical protein
MGNAAIATVIFQLKRGRLYHFAVNNVFDVPQKKKSMGVKSGPRRS